MSWNPFRKMFNKSHPATAHPAQAAPQLPKPEVPKTDMPETPKVDVPKDANLERAKAWRRRALKGTTGGLLVGGIAGSAMDSAGDAAMKTPGFPTYQPYPYYGGPAMMQHAQVDDDLMERLAKNLASQGENSAYNKKEKQNSKLGAKSVSHQVAGFHQTAFKEEKLMDRLQKSAEQAKNYHSSEESMKEYEAAFTRPWNPTPSKDLKHGYHNMNEEKEASAQLDRLEKQAEEEQTRSTGNVLGDSTRFHALVGGGLGAVGGGLSGAISGLGIGGGKGAALGGLTGLLGGGALGAGAGALKGVIDGAIEQPIIDNNMLGVNPEDSHALAGAKAGALTSGALGAVMGLPAGPAGMLAGGLSGAIGGGISSGLRGMYSDHRDQTLERTAESQLDRLSKTAEQEQQRSTGTIIGDRARLQAMLGGAGGGLLGGAMGAGIGGIHAGGRGAAIGGLTGLLGGGALGAGAGALSGALNGLTTQPIVDNNLLGVDPDDSHTMAQAKADAVLGAGSGAVTGAGLSMARDGITDSFTHGRLRQMIEQADPRSAEKLQDLLAQAPRGGMKGALQSGISHALSGAAVGGLGGALHGMYSDHRDNKLERTAEAQIDRLSKTAEKEDDESNLKHYGIKGAKIGAGIGGGLGALIGASAASDLAMHGAGPGPVAGALMGGLGGAINHGLLGGLIGGGYGAYRDHQEDKTMKREASSQIDRLSKTANATQWMKNVWGGEARAAQRGFHDARDAARSANKNYRQVEDDFESALNNPQARSSDIFNLEDRAMQADKMRNAANETAGQAKQQMDVTRAATDKARRQAMMGAAGLGAAGLGGAMYASHGSAPQEQLASEQIDRLSKTALYSNMDQALRGGLMNPVKAPDAGQDAVAGGLIGGAVGGAGGALAGHLHPHGKRLKGGLIGAGIGAGIGALGHYTAANDRHRSHLGEQAYLQQKQAFTTVNDLYKVAEDMQMLALMSEATGYSPDELMILAEQSPEEFAALHDQVMAAMAQPAEHVASEQTSLFNKLAGLPVVHGAKPLYGKPPKDAIEVGKKGMGMGKKLAIGAGVVGAGALAANAMGDKKEEEEKKASETEDAMNALYKEAASAILNEDVPKVKKHIDPIDRITFPKKKK